MKGNYDKIAWFYDRLARLIYGSTLINAQRYLIAAIPPESSIIIIGGGTGEILEEIARLHPEGLTITYVDSSDKMIKRAEKRKCGFNEVTFIAGDIERAILVKDYQVVLTPFLFDNFADETLGRIFDHINGHVAIGGKWLYCDFRDTEVFWQKIVLRVMYKFFRTSCGIEASKLPDVDSCFAQHHYRLLQQRTFMKRFIMAAVYQKR